MADIKTLKEKIKKLQDEVSSMQVKLGVEEGRVKTILTTLKDEFDITDPTKIVEKLEQMKTEKELLEKEVDAILAEVNAILTSGGAGRG